jgi:hypothetical protein
MLIGATAEGGVPMDEEDVPEGTPIQDKGIGEVNPQLRSPSGTLGNLQGPSSGNLQSGPSAEASAGASVSDLRGPLAKEQRETLKDEPPTMEEVPPDATTVGGVDPVVGASGSNPLQVGASGGGTRRGSPTSQERNITTDRQGQAQSPSRVRWRTEATGRSSGTIRGSS